MYLMKKEMVTSLATQNEDKLAKVKSMLVNATTLELATLPPYLTGVYSVKPGTNQAAKAVATAVAVEEMLHMALAANILIAIGGSIDLFEIGKNLKYPTTLPGCVDSGFVVHVAAMVPEQIKQVFMEIERPETPAILPGEYEPAPEFKEKEIKGYASIGEFYMEIQNLLKELPDAFANPRLDRQINLQPWFPTTVEGVPDGRARDFKSAYQMIETIIVQGEGALGPRQGTQLVNASVDPIGNLKESFAHYFAFGELYYGAELIKRSGIAAGWSYMGKTVHMDMDGIYNLLPNACLDDYPRDSAAWYAASAFYDSYLRLLASLGHAFDGQPERFSDAIGLMYELKLLADRVMLFPADDDKPDGFVAAPPFQKKRNPDYPALPPYMKNNQAAQTTPSKP